MLSKLPSAGRVVVWFFALAIAIFSARYFMNPPPLVNPPDGLKILQGPVGESLKNAAPYLYNHHRALLLTHISCGIVALVFGLFQFARSLRKSRPVLHRMMGRFYVAATVLGGIMGIPLSFMMFVPYAPAIRILFYPTLAGLVSLSVAWPIITLMAVTRAMQHRFADHRAWMIRSYALTFAAPTSRIIAPLLLLLTGDLVLAINVTFVSWPVNLIVSELLIRREANRSASVALPQVANVTAP
jgi:uncharacterized membrane protein YozB (DUF420 family)